MTRIQDSNSYFKLNMPEEMILVFDLDDTLYPEITYVYSGFRAVGRLLEKTFRIPAPDSVRIMTETLEKEGRGKVFDVVLLKFGVYSKKNVKACLSAYRLHKPTIQLYEDAQKVLNNIKERRKYIVTDGNKMVQQRKVEALRLSGMFDKIFITHRYGTKRSKPDPYCFLKICTLENVDPRFVMYIGDNPKKDFVGIKKLGFKTARVKRGMFKDVIMAPEYEADFCVDSLLDLVY